MGGLRDRLAKVRAVKWRDWSDVGVLVLVATALVVALSWLWMQDRQDAGSHPLGAACEPATPPTPIDPAQIAAAGQLPEVEVQDTVQVRSLGRERDRFTVRTFLQLSTPLPEGVAALNVRMGQFQRADGYSMEPEQLSASATVDSESTRQVVEVLLCVDPVTNIKDNAPPLVAKAGSYTGTVYIDDPRVAGGSVTYRVNMKYDRIYQVLLVVLVGWLLGALGGLALSSGLAWNSLGTNVHRTLAALVGGGTAVYLVYVAQYDNDPSWQGDSALFTALFATCVGAAYTATNVAGTATLGRAADRSSGS
jgi:hypothetical protein